MGEEERGVGVVDGRRVVGARVGNFVRFTTNALIFFVGCTVGRLFFLTVVGAQVNTTLDVGNDEGCFLIGLHA